MGDLKTGARAAWVAQSAERPTLNFGSGHDPRVVGLSLESGSALNMEPGLRSLSLCPTSPLALSKQTNGTIKTKQVPDKGRKKVACQQRGGKGAAR